MRCSSATRRPGPVAAGRPRSPLIPSRGIIAQDQVGVGRPAAWGSRREVGPAPGCSSERLGVGGASTMILMDRLPARRVGAAARRMACLTAAVLAAGCNAGGEHRRVGLDHSAVAAEAVGGPSRDGTGVGAVRRQAGLDVLLITVDTLRADALGSYGNSRNATPWMDRLAATGVRFEDAHAHNVVTLPSHATILSGLHPQEHGVRFNENDLRRGTLPLFALNAGCESEEPSELLARESASASQRTA